MCQCHKNISQVSCVTDIYYYTAKDTNPFSLGGLPGVAGRDYPVHPSPPPTDFSCAELEPGFYADTEADCQTYHRLD